MIIRFIIVFEETQSQWLRWCYFASYSKAVLKYLETMCMKKLLSLLKKLDGGPKSCAASSFLF